eukprot:TRINITY_DN6168_c0_g1_i2.p1 TRINITY_DN6168_c0_g1~~TRINITY_DN6168_c0_g1_i2.p1  ORF type:complete len:323 (+),score=51.65 TRINITY_DN6168_c0_g1_i2:206-1174(+)
MATGSLTNQANSLRIVKIEKCFGANGVPLRKPGRMLRGEGVLNKVCRKVVKPRQFFLFNDILVYGSIIQEKVKYAKQKILSLEDMQFVSLPDTANLKNAWLISTPGKSFTVCAASPGEKAQWLGHLTKATGTEAASSMEDVRFKGHAPNWVPDTEADLCMVCTKVQFTLMKRRHHCRACGAVVCGACSSKRKVLPNIGSKPVRVCDPCFDKPDAGVPAQEDDGESDDDEEQAVDVNQVPAGEMNEANQRLAGVPAQDRMQFYNTSGSSAEVATEDVTDGSSPQSPSETGAAASLSDGVDVKASDAQDGEQEQEHEDEVTEAV